jgi:hypothetical protein
VTTTIETPAPAIASPPPSSVAPGRPNPGPAKSRSTPIVDSPDRPTPGTPDHTGYDDHAEIVGGAGFTLYDPALYLLAAQLDNVEALRIAVENRHRQATRSVADGDGHLRGLGLPEDDPAVAASTVLLAALAEAEKAATKVLERQLRHHPLGGWQRSVKGVGEKQLARLLAAVGDPYMNATTGRPRTVSQLWALCGLHVVPASGQTKVDTREVNAGGGDSTPDGGQATGGAQRSGAAVRPGTAGHPDHRSGDTHGRIVGVAARRARGQRANWSVTAKTRAYLIAQRCMISGGPYRETYEQARSKYADAVHPAPCPRCGRKGEPAPPGSPLRPGHQNARALRYVAKRLLRDLWRESKRLHEQAIHP